MICNYLADITIIYIGFALNAFDVASGFMCDFVFQNGILNSEPSLVPGVYCYDSLVANSGVITLDAGGDTEAEFVFMTPSLVTSSYLSWNLINGASEKNVYWVVGSTATIAPFSDFIGVFLGVTTTVKFGEQVSFIGQVLGPKSVTFGSESTLSLVATASSTSSSSAPSASPSSLSGGGDGGLLPILSHLPLITSLLLSNLRGAEVQK